MSITPEARAIGSTRLPDRQERVSGSSRAERLCEALEEAAHLLPRQGPIGVFVHHNTLHAFEHLPFERAVIEAWKLFGAEPYMSEAAYRRELARGRIRVQDVDAVLAAEPDVLIFPQLSRRSLRRAMIMPGVREFDAATILWRIEQGDLAKDFRQPSLRSLYEVCLSRAVPHADDSAPPNPLNELIHPWLIRFCSVFLDQGMAYWTMPERDQGFYVAVRNLLCQPYGIFPRYLVGLDEEFRRQRDLGFSAIDAVLDYLDVEQIPETHWKDLIQAELLALPGWAGLMRRLEEEPRLAPHRPLPSSLMDFLAVRLTMIRVATREGAAEGVRQESPLKTKEKLRMSRAARIYDAARVLSLSAAEVAKLSDSEWQAFTGEVRACNGLERRRILHLAYERRHEHSVLSGLASHRHYRGLTEHRSRPAAQLFFCIDEREESMRRALEEVDPRIETFGAVGYYGVAIDYLGIDDAHGSALCPVALEPQHAVLERPKEEDVDLLETRRRRRRLLAQLMRYWYLSSRTLVRGWLSTGTLGLLSLVPLVGHLLAPRKYAQLRDWLNQAFFPEPRTELTFMRNTAESQHAIADLLIGFSVEEKTDRLVSVLGPAGLTKRFARLVVVLGHGSTSLNNPHESAHDCGACGGRRGGPNARLFAAMANRPEVRERLRSRGIEIPHDTWFVGGYHDTCSDEIELYDLDAVPSSHQADLIELRQSLDRARALNAHERVRRFLSRRSHVALTPEKALQHVEERSQHLAQPRPEYGHCTNAVCIIGRRSLTRGLFLDRRAFLVSYDPLQDPEAKSLTDLLGAVVPVCAGISLEYYFSFVDNERYGCGTKLPHNVVGMVGVMDGHASDLRTGLPWQMVEIHEPLRILFVVESNLEQLRRALDSNSSVRRLLENRWIRLATIDPVAGTVHLYQKGGFAEFHEPLERLPVALSSMEWYGGKSEHLPMAWIQAAAGC